MKKGDVIADGPATEHGRAGARPERARRVHAVGGYNFEDSILISERLVKDDVFTSIHIEEFECVARDTKLGKEEITRDIPNVGEEALKDLDESGIVRIGAEVKPGDILVGKITPKGETQLSPEEKLLRAIFGEKAGDVRDTLAARAAGRRRASSSTPRCSRARAPRRTSAPSDIEDAEEAKLLEGPARRDQDHPRLVLRQASRKLLVGKDHGGKLVDDKGKVLLQQGREARRRHRSTRSRTSYWAEIQVERRQDRARSCEQLAASLEENIEARSKRSSATRSPSSRKGDELPPGVIKMVKVYVAIKRKLSVGDKMAGRHGNKGVVSPHPARRGHAVPARTARRSTSC